ncbi:glutathione S-transferase [Plastoroseomonas hellenica]|uniref:glutathione S-transferase n=1 Tax=Plastoroseomonas hellenica TaxID=2687306 RepID=UPI001BABF82C|nr:glutathione S-transferase [Plastoroseomonas hellenica]MBR0647930.1 glutathione S-transferase [Plastoroseomonas hellenica]
MAAYELHYWPGLQGRGEFVRLALEEAGVAYRDVAKEGSEGQAAGAVAAGLGAKDIATPPYAPPFLKHGKRIIGQTAAILLYLGERHGLAPNSEAGRLWTHQVQLTIADVVTEVHDTHHPVASGLYYEDQKAEARRRAEDFRQNRMGSFLAWFETILDRNPKGRGHLIGARVTYAELSLFQLVAGLTYAFPKATRRALKRTPKVAALAEAVAARPRIAAYLASERRIPFNEYGIFRHYPELDP